MSSKKKLLVIGGSTAACNIVNKAREMGIYTIVADQFTDSPAKAIADESYTISTYDVDGLVRLCIEKNINGIITGYIDSILPYYQEVCERLSFPCYTTKEQIGLTTNKRKFKKACIENDIPVISEYCLTSEYLKSDLEKIEYPVLVKPVDNQGSRGIFVCYNEIDLIKACTKALEFSKTKDFLVEKYMDVPSVNMIYHLDNGKILLEAMMDRRVNNCQIGYAKLAEALVFPSQYLNIYLDGVNNKVIQMFKNYGFKNGTIFLQAFFDKGRFLIYEMGHRLPGSQTYKLVEKCCNYSPMKLLINFSLTGSMTDNNFPICISPQFNNKKAVILICLVREGIIKTVEGIDLIRGIPEVISIDQKLFPNGEVQLVGTMQQILARIHIVSDNIDSIVAAIQKISSCLHVYDINGNNQLFNIYDAKDLYSWIKLKV